MAGTLALRRSLVVKKRSTLLTNLNFHDHDFLLVMKSRLSNHLLRSMVRVHCCVVAAAAAM
jgi:hypothetical protein